MSTGRHGTSGRHHILHHRPSRNRSEHSSWMSLEGMQPVVRQFYLRIDPDLTTEGTPSSAESIALWYQGAVLNITVVMFINGLHARQYCEPVLTTHLG